MSALTSLLANYDKIAYTSYFDADKIAIYSTKNDSSGDGIGVSASMTAVAPGVASDIQTSVATMTNPYGKRCLMSISWSLDNVNFYPINVPIFYFNATFQSYFWRALVSGGCSDSTIYIIADSQYTSNQTVYFNFALDSPT